ncbi:hypothetical protein [Paracerasibacillus soli]|uniref:Uncharacterized protein n=1 Tax=Paracerasibacillus soli TaxID=480284 RepID=A0ABU5CT29_9BACI|nr:hypothetical protein [Virgibacillus soli]MDY0409528.1 hypothetical protein [Virgibacillus soli]
MKNWQEIIHHTTFRYIDSTKETTFHHKKNDAFTSFAIDDALATSISNGSHLLRCDYGSIQKLLYSGSPMEEFLI